MRGVPCIILLGEPGIGKSHVLEKEKNDVDNKSSDTDEVLYFNLNSFKSDFLLVNKVFENEAVESWKKADYNLYMFLDSLDESLEEINTLSNLLLELFKDFPMDRFFLRIACRSMDWPETLENGLRNFWGENEVKIFELCPLRKTDVIMALNDNSVNVSEFLNVLKDLEAIPFAIKPVTLDFLISIYLESGTLPSTKYEVYKQGCNHLCKEVSKQRKDAKHEGQLTFKKKFLIASRIAVALLLSNKQDIWLGSDLKNVPEDAVKIDELVGVEKFEDKTIIINESDIKETLKTGLFSSIDKHRHSWAHKTYAEFLAAYYIYSHKISLDKIFNLIVHPDEGRIIPQFKEIVAWLAVLIPELFSSILISDPDILLLSDFKKIPDEKVKDIVDSLLHLFDEEIIIDDVNYWQYYAKLNHPLLKEQLLDYISDNTKGLTVRRAAIEIAEACELKDIQEEIVKIVLDFSNDLYLRNIAAHYICNVGDDDTKSKLKPLIDDYGEDPNDEIKGCVLQALWPKFLSAKELFSILSPPKRGNFIGMYSLFINNEIISYLKPEDLKYGLEWVKNLYKSEKPSHLFIDLSDKLILFAFDNIKLNGILELLGVIILLKTTNSIISYLEDYEIKLKEIIENTEIRHKLIKCMVPLISNPHETALSLLFSDTPLIFNEDFPWLIQCLEKSQTEDMDLIWVELLKKTYRDSVHRNILEESLNSNLISINSKESLRSLILSKSTIIEYNRKLSYQISIGNYFDNITKIEESFKHNSKLKKSINQFEDGLLEKWCEIIYLLTLKNGRILNHLNHFEPDITKMPGWREITDDIKNKILLFAKSYVNNANPKKKVCLTNVNSYPVNLFGYKALFFIYKYDHDYFLEISPEVFDKWVKTILAYPTTQGNNFTFQCDIIETVYKKVPNELIKVLPSLIKQEDGNVITILSKIDAIFDERVERTLMFVLKHYKLHSESVGLIIRYLVSHDSQKSLNYAKSLITSYKSENEKSTAVLIAYELLKNTNDSVWPLIWKVIQKDSDFGEQLISKMAHFGFVRKDIFEKLDENDVADLYIWLTERFPQDEDPEFDDVHFIGVRESIGTFRNSLLSYLTEVGTYNACESIQKLIIKLPEMKWLNTRLVIAKESFRKAWVPSSPKNILRVLVDQKLYVVSTNDQLLNVILDSLKRLQEKLHGETPAVIFLWNKFKHDNYFYCRPKLENEFSDFVKLHLEDDIAQRGIIVNREVQIRSGRSDLHIVAQAEDSDEKYKFLKVVIESKACYHQELNRAMETQLLNHYIKGTNYTHGLYLVPWFLCDEWDEKDRKKTNTPMLTVDQAQEKFDLLARNLSNNEIIIKAFVMDTTL